MRGTAWLMRTLQWLDEVLFLETPLSLASEVD